jgi:NAD(P)-dependent dehydrogenase (short-subunit alcohol dehydrogenase family)
MGERVETVDGHETTLQVNHLSMFLLTHELLPLVCAARAARVLTVSSVTHFRGVIDFDDLEHRRDYSGMAAYSDTKLYNVLFAQELAERLKCEAATSNVLHPGTVATKLLAAGFPAAEGAPLADGAATILYLAASPAVSDVTGAYFVDKRQAHASPKTRDPEVRRRLWDLSAEMVGV